MQTDTENIRPESYWSHNDPLAQILAGVSGKARRAMIKDFWEAGNLEQMEDALLNDELEPEQRTRLGQIHPFFMGGEYLPERLAGEVTIARIDLESTTYDVIGGGFQINARNRDLTRKAFGQVFAAHKKRVDLAEARSLLGFKFVIE